MKVLIVTNLYPNAREPGRGIFNKQQFDELAKLCDIKIIAPVVWRPGRDSRAEHTERHREDGIEVFHPSWLAIPKIGRPLHGRFYYWGIKKLFNKVCREWQPDVALATWAYPDAYAVSQLCTQGEYLAQRPQRAQRDQGGAAPSTSVDGVHPSLPMVIKVHGTDINAGMKVGWKRRMIRKALESADGIVAVSEALKRKIHLLGIGTEAEVIPNGVDADLFKPLDKQESQKRLGLHPERKHILFVGNIAKVKGLKYLIKAMADLPEDVDLHVVGNGSKQKATKKTKGEKAQRIIFHGRVPHSEIPIWMNAADVFCLPSLQEGCPNVIVEALACGLPVVATNVGGIPELIDSDQKGTLVEPGDSKGLAGELCASLARSDRMPSPTKRIRSWADAARELRDMLQSAPKQRLATD